MFRVCRRALAKHGLKMNFSKGKTECIMRLFGRGSQELVAGLQCIDGQKVITVDDADQIAAGRHVVRGLGVRGRRQS